MSNVVVFGGGAFGRFLGHEGGTLINGVSTFRKSTTELSFDP